MSTSKRTKILHNLAMIAEEDEKNCKRYIQVISQFSNTLGRANLKNTCLPNIEYKNMFEKSYINEKDYNDQYQELVIKIKGLQEMKKTLINREEKIEILKHKLESNNESLKHIEQLADLKILLKYYKILPAEFDYSDKKVTGFIFNLDNVEYHGFELDTKSTEENTIYLWKQIEKLCTK